MNEKLYYQPVGRGFYEAWVYVDGDTHYVLRSAEEDEIRGYARRHRYRLVFVDPAPQYVTPTRKQEDYEYRWRKDGPRVYTVWLVSRHTGSVKDMISEHATERGAIAATRRLNARNG